jgi:DNA-binding NarL/FixJ family response regulator
MHKAKKLRTHDKILVLSSNGSNKTKGKMVDWRRNKVQQLLVRGYSQWDVAEELQIDQSTVSRDIQYLRHQAQENLQNMSNKNFQKNISAV